MWKTRAERDARGQDRTSEGHYSQGHMGRGDQDLGRDSIAYDRSLEYADGGRWDIDNNRRVDEDLGCGQDLHARDYQQESRFDDPRDQQLYRSETDNQRFDETRWVDSRAVYSQNIHRDSLGDTFEGHGGDAYVRNERRNDDLEFQDNRRHGDIYLEQDRYDNVDSRDIKDIDHYDNRDSQYDNRDRQPDIRYESDRNPLYLDHRNDDHRNDRGQNFDNVNRDDPHGRFDHRDSEHLDHSNKVSGQSYVEKFERTIDKNTRTDRNRDNRGGRIGRGGGITNTVRARGRQKSGNNFGDRNRPFIGNSRSINRSNMRKNDANNSRGQRGTATSMKESRRGLNRGRSGNVRGRGSITRRQDDKSKTNITQKINYSGTSPRQSTSAASTGHERSSANQDKSKNIPSGSKTNDKHPSASASRQNRHTKSRGTSSAHLPHTQNKSRDSSKDRSSRTNSRSSSNRRDEKKSTVKAEPRNDRSVKSEDSFKRPKDVHRSRNISKNESDHGHSHVHEDDILSIMADDDHFDKDTKKIFGSESSTPVKRKGSRDRESKQSDYPVLEIHAEVSESFFGEVSPGARGHLNFGRSASREKNEKDNKSRVDGKERGSRTSYSKTGGQRANSRSDRQNDGIKSRWDTNNTSRSKHPYHHDKQNLNIQRGGQAGQDHKRRFVGNNKSSSDQRFKGTGFNSSFGRFTNTHVYASKIRKRTLQNVRNSDNIRNDKLDIKNVVNRRGSKYQHPFTKQVSTGKSGAVIREDNKRLSDIRKSRTDQKNSVKAVRSSGTIFVDDRTKKPSDKRDRSGSANERVSSERGRTGGNSERGRTGVNSERGRTGAILKDDRNTVSNRRDNLVGSKQREGRGSSDRKRETFGRDQLSGRSNSTMYKRDSQGFKSERDGIGGKYRSRDLKHYDRMKKKYIGGFGGRNNANRNRHFNRSNAGKSTYDKPEELNNIAKDMVLDDRRVVLSGDDVPIIHQPVDGTPPVYFIPNPDLGQQQFVDPLGNVIINPEVGIPQGEVPLQYIHQPLPPQDVVGSPGEQLIFIPFNQMHGYPENLAPPPLEVGKEVGDMKEEKLEQKKSIEEGLTSKKQPLSKEARTRIRNRLMQKKRQQLEKKIEQKVLQKLLKTANLGGTSGSAWMGMQTEERKKPMIKRISPPSATGPSHIGKKIKLVKRTKQETVKLDDVSDEDVYDNVSEYEDVSDIEDVSEEEENYGESSNRRSSQRGKRPVFRKPGQPRVTNSTEISSSHATIGDVRRVVDHRSVKGNNASTNRKVTEINRSKRHFQQTNISEKKPTFIKKRRSISPIEITVRNDRKSPQQRMRQSTGQKRQDDSRYTEEKDKYNSARADKDDRAHQPRRRTRSDSGSRKGHRERSDSADRSHDRSKGSGKYSQKRDQRNSSQSEKREEQNAGNRMDNTRQQDRGRHNKSPRRNDKDGKRSPSPKRRSRSPRRYSRSSPRRNSRSSPRRNTESPKGRSRSPRRDRSRDRDNRKQRNSPNRDFRGNQDRRYENDNNKNTQYGNYRNDGQSQYKSTPPMSSRYSPAHSRSLSVQGQHGFMHYGNSNVPIDHSLPPQHPSHMSAPIPPPIMNMDRMVPDMSMPPQIVSGNASSMPQMVVQQPHLQQQMSGSHFQHQNSLQQQQQFQPHFQQQFQQLQQPLMQQQQMFQQPLNQGQQQVMSSMSGSQVIQQPNHFQQVQSGMAMMPNMNQSPMQQGSLMNTGQMMGQSRPTLPSVMQSSHGQQQGYVAATPSQAIRGVLGTVTTGSLPSQQMMGTKAVRLGNKNQVYRSYGIQNKPDTSHSTRGSHVGNRLATMSKATGSGRNDSKPSSSFGGYETWQNYKGGKEEDDDEMVELLCSKCDKVFLNDGAMRKHKKWHDKVTSTDTVFRCDICEQAFLNKGQYDGHAREKHLLDAWSCNLCDKNFDNSTQLEHHFQHVDHTPTKLLYNCSLCPANFMSAKYLVQHKIDHHRRSGNQGSFGRK